MYTKENVDQWHKDHGPEFRLKCMIGAAKGKARIAKSKGLPFEKHLQEADKLTVQLSRLKETAQLITELKERTGT